MKTKTCFTLGKSGFLAIVIFIFHHSASFAQATTNPYDLLGRVLVPLASIFSPDNPQRSLTAELTLEEADGIPKELFGTVLELSLQPPDRLLLRTEYQETTFSVCRAGQDIWLTPGYLLEQFFPFLAAAPPEKRDTADAKKNLPPMVLPFSTKQLALLPILFKVEDAGKLGGMRVLSVRLMRELARSVGAEEWSARLWVSEQGELRRVEIQQPGWRAAFKVENLQLKPTLPNETWIPQDTDVTRHSGPEAAVWVKTVAARLREQQ